jgi:hypothetical protein
MNLKKSILGLAMVTLIGTSAFHPANAALVGTFAANPAVALLCLEVPYLTLMANKADISKPTFGLWFLGMLLILDKDSNEVEFAAISDLQANKMGLNSIEKESYNSELDRLNAAFSEMNSTLLNTSKEQMDLVKKDAMEQFKSNISVDTFTAIQKILSASVK